MIGTFPGKLALAEGEEVDVDLEIAGGKLRLTTGVSEIGSWPTTSCAITPVGDGYRLTLDGELVSFTPDHPEAFAAVVRDMSPSSTSRSAPVPVTDPDPGESSGYDLEAALDQVLGGSDDDHHAAVIDDSPDDIAVTLEALFATAYTEFDDHHVEEDDETPAAYAGLEEVPSEEPSEEAPMFGTSPVEAADELSELDEEQPAATVEEPARRPFDSATSSDQVTSAEDEEMTFPSVAAWPEPESPGLPSIEHAEYGAAAVYGISETDAATDDEEEEGWVGPAAPLDERFDDEPAAFGGSPADRFRPGGFQPGGPAAYDDGDVYHDSPYGADSGTSGRPTRPAYREPFEPERPAASHGMEDRPAASFDLDGAVRGAGYAPPPLGDETGDDMVAAERSGMFSRSASERFASVSGAIRSRLVSDESGIESDAGALESEDDLSIADQIVADQQEAERETRGKRFTPALVKKLAIGAIVVFVITGIVLVTPTLIRLLADQIEQPQAVTTVSTTAPAEPTTETSQVVAPTEDTAGQPDGADAEILQPSVFSLTPAQFAERWDTIVESASIEIGNAYQDRTGLGFTQYLGLEWAVDADGTIGSYRVVLDPKGDQRDDELGIAALAWAIDVSHPEYEGGDLSEVLGSLGLDVNNPTLELDGSTSRDGVRYALAYNPDRELVILDVTPGGGQAPTTTTTSAG